VRLAPPPPACPSATLYSTQEDPIGLAGGLNLYGYGAGDPVNNRDPFGLSSDTVRAEPDETADLEQFCFTNAYCREAYDAAHAAPYTVTLVRTPNDAKCKSRSEPAACTFHESFGSTVIDMTIYYSPSNFPDAARSYGVPSLTYAEVLTHEFVHAVRGPAEARPRFDQNRVRLSLGLPPITLGWP
jgi:uncharacterized protein RhaS with RHS repeats